MKIVEIVCDRSEVTVNGIRRVAFRTNPPLTDLVWSGFCEGGYQGDCWEKQDGFLVWVGDGGLDCSMINDTENYLSRIERKHNTGQIKEQEYFGSQIENVPRNEPVNGPIDYAYLRKVSKRTLRPLV